MLSLGDAHVNLEELEAQFGGASFKLDVFYQDGQPEPEADMAHSRSSMSVLQCWDMQFSLVVACAQISIGCEKYIKWLYVVIKC